MYGLVNKAIEDLIVANFGEEKWEAVKSRAGVDVDVFISSEPYPDHMTYDLVAAASVELGAPADEILKAFGEHWVLKTASEGYGPMMRSGGRTLGEFLVNLPNFHTRVAMVYPNLEPPRFRCSEVTDRSLRLHYMTHRTGLTAFVIGLLSGLGKMFGTPVQSTVVARKDQGAECDVFDVTWGEAVP